MEDHHASTGSKHEVSAEQTRSTIMETITNGTPMDKFNLAQTACTYFVGANIVGGLATIFFM